MKFDYFAVFPNNRLSYFREQRICHSDVTRLIEYIKSAKSAFLRYYAEFRGIKDSDKSTTDKSVLKVIQRPSLRDPGKFKYRYDFLNQISDEVIYQSGVAAMHRRW